MQDDLIVSLYWKRDEKAIDSFRKRNCAKRKKSAYAVSLSELEDCISAGNTTEQEVDLHFQEQKHGTMFLDILIYNI